MHGDPTAPREVVGASRRANRAIGFRRVEQVRIVVGEGRTRAIVVGIVHRYPVEVPVSMRTARRLIDAGARVTVVGRRAA